MEKKIVKFFDILFLCEVHAWTIINDKIHTIKNKKIRNFTKWANHRDQLLHSDSASTIDTLLWKK